VAQARPVRPVEVEQLVGRQVGQDDPAGAVRDEHGVDHLLQDGRLLGDLVAQPSQHGVAVALGAQPVRDVGDHHQHGVASLKDEIVGGHLDVAGLAILADVLPLARLPIRRALCREGLVEERLERLHVLGRPDLGDPHRQELVAGVAVQGHARVVDIQEAQRLQVVHPHRGRVIGEEQPEQRVAACAQGRGMDGADRDAWRNDRARVQAVPG
jgi:hypothetical protein